MTFTSDSFQTVIGEKDVVEIRRVVAGSPAERVGFRVGDSILAVNNMPITSEKQATKLLGSLSGELNVLIERKLDNIDNEDDIAERLASNEDADGSSSDGFVKVGFDVSGNFEEENLKTCRRKAHSESNLMDFAGINALHLEEEATPAPLRKARSSLGLRSYGSTLEETTTESPSIIPLEDGEDSGRKWSSESPVVTVSPPASAGEFQPPPSPTLSRRQKITAKASEKAANLAGKWNFGKGVVKDLWQKRRHDVADTFEVPTKTGTLQVLDYTGIPASKSVESSMSNRLNGSSNSSSLAEIAANEETPAVLRAPLSRSRSRSEPDTSLLTELNGNAVDMEEIRVVDTEAGDDVASRTPDDVMAQEEDAAKQRPSGSTWTKETKSSCLKTVSLGGVISL